MPHDVVAEASVLPARRSALVSGRFAGAIGAFVVAVGTGVLLGAVVALAFLPALALVLGLAGLGLRVLAGPIVRAIETKTPQTLEIVEGALVVGTEGTGRILVSKMQATARSRASHESGGARIVVRGTSGTLLEAQLLRKDDARALLRELGALGARATG